MIMELNAEQKVHLAAQYLAAFAINYLTPHNDDSHTNLGFDPVSKSLSTRAFGNKEYRLVFEYENFSLKLTSIETSFTLALNGQSHIEVLNWIGEKMIALGVEKNFNYSFHYEIPYVIIDNYTFIAPASGKISALLSIRTLAHKSISEFLANNNFKGEIRVWPHHFDSGAFVTIDFQSNKQMGIGIAIADDMINEPYFYASGYDQNGSLEVNEFKELRHGDWVKKGFKGAVLRSRDLNSGIVTDFFEESLNAFLK